MSNIKYLGFAKPCSSVPVLGQLEVPDSPEELKAEAIKVPDVRDRYVLCEPGPDEAEGLRAQG